MPTSKIDVDRVNRIVDMDFSSKETQKELLGIIEKLCSQIIELQKENQELKDENMRLKGEKGKPEIKASVKTEPERDAKKMEKTYIAKLPESLQGTEFGPETKALVASLYYENRVTENKIASFLNSNGLLISEGLALLTEC